MNVALYTAALIAIAATALALTRSHAVHALLYFVVSLFAVALIFYMIGAPFAAALEIIIYASAVVVLFLFVVMLLDLGPQGAPNERGLVKKVRLAGPMLLALALASELILIVSTSQDVRLSPLSTPASPDDSGSRCSEPTASASNSCRCCCSPRLSVLFT